MIKLQEVFQQLSNQNIALDVVADKANRSISELLVRTIKLFCDFSPMTTGLFIPVSSGFFNFGERFQENELYFIGAQDNLNININEFLNYYSIIKKIDLSISGELFEQDLLMSPVIIEATSTFIRVLIDEEREIIGLPTIGSKELIKIYSNIALKIFNKHNVNIKFDSERLYRIDISSFSEFLSAIDLPLVNLNSALSNSLNFNKGEEFINEKLKAALALIYLYSLRLGNPKTYFYYIPSICLIKQSENFVKEKKGYGILALVTDKLLSKDELLVLKSSSKDTYLSIAVISEERLQKDFFISAIKNSVSSILSRNFSHNIGSHVMHNADLGKIINKLNCQNKQFNSIEGELNAHRYASALKSLLDRYVVERNEYLADVSESTMPAGNYAKFYAEVVMPFVENFLLTDNIAAAEGIGFPSPNDDNRLQIRVFVDKDRELITVYDAYFDDNGGKLLKPNFRAGYPNVPEVQPDEEPLHLPYRLPLLGKGFGFEQENATLELIETKYIESFFHTKKTVARNTITNHYFLDGDAGDVEVALPGVLGRHAFYSLLENFIRNSAKHNKEKLKSHNLVIEINLSSLEEPDIIEGRFKSIHDAWKITLTTPGFAWLTIGQFKKLEKYVNAPLISSQTGIPITTGLGIADMVVSASILAGSFDFDFSESKPQNKFFRIEKLEEKDGMIRFAYTFYLLKAKRIICLTQNTISQSNGYDWLVQGISFVRSVEDMYNHMGKQSYQMAVLDADLLENAFGENQDEYEKLLSRLPFRVIVKENPQNGYSGKYWRKLATQRRLVIYEGEIQCKSPLEFRRFCWEQWLLRFYPELKNESLLPLQLHLYLEHKHKNWENAAKRDFGALLQLHVYTPEKDVFQYKEGSVNLIYDHHGRLLGKMAGKADFVENDSYTIFDKNSADFPRLLYPDENTLEVLPYAMAEAALMRVLVMDERVAERASLDADMGSRYLGDADPNFKKNSSEGILINDRVFELAWAGGVHIVTHYQINNEPPQPLNEKIPQPENAPQLTFHIETDTSGKLGKIHFSSNLPCKDGSQFEAGGNHYHMLLVHRTILKQIQESVHQVCPDFQFLREVKDVIPFTVVDSGGGYPDEIRSEYKGSFKFLPFSFMSEHLLRNRIAKVGLTQLLMGLTDAKRE